MHVLRLGCLDIQVVDEIEVGEPTRVKAPVKGERFESEYQLSPLNPSKFSDSGIALAVARETVFSCFLKLFMKRNTQ
jgi:hypothetical protein